MYDNNFASLLELMQKPEFYPHSVQTPIQLVQTHVSAVLLTGDYAYKVKKPVNFGFLDFSTLAKRKHFISEEIRINQPIAPDIYLTVLPITQSENTLALDGDGEAVEYVLKMRQFPQENLFINMFERGELTETLMEELGRLTSQFHAQTITNDYIRGFGEIDKIRESIDENYQQTNKYIGLVQTQQQYAETKEFTDKFFLSREALFKSRRDEHKIRECHGDLHLKNICYWQDKIQLFDRIEFNESFRFVDVMYDVAFAVMDLEARGKKDFANAFLNTYVEETGDWEGLQVLPVYLSRQAYVRAKVTSFLLDDPNIPETVKTEAMATASNYYRLAWEYTKPREGKISLMSGLSGSGKSTTAKKIARHTGAVILRSDAIRKHLAGIPLQEKGGDELYSSEMNEKTYNRLLELGVLLAKQGFAVVLDAKYDREKWRSKAIEQATSNQLALEIIYCTAPVEILRERLRNRHDISDATEDLLASQQNTADAFNQTEQKYLRVIDTSKVD